MLKESNFHKARGLLVVRQTLQYLSEKKRDDTRDWVLRFHRPNGDIMTDVSDREAVEVALAAMRVHLHTVEKQLREIGVELDRAETETA